MGQKKYLDRVLSGRVATIALLSATVVRQASAEAHKLEWDPSPDATRVTDYRIYYGTIPGIYTTMTNAGLAKTPSRTAAATAP